MIYFQKKIFVNSVFINDNIKSKIPMSNFPDKSMLSNNINDYFRLEKKINSIAKKFV